MSMLRLACSNVNRNEGMVWNQLTFRHAGQEMASKIASYDMFLVVTEM